MDTPHDDRLPPCPVGHPAPATHTGAAIARRRWLLRATALAGGGWLLAAPGARLALAAPAATSRRTVVVMLRGALDGLAAVPPVGDPDFASLRPEGGAVPAGPGVPPAVAGPALGLDGRFALHPGLATLHRWYGEGALLVAHAVASPYRERSHFDAQQMLESGGPRPFALDTGWLGRALGAGGFDGGAGAVAMGPALPLVLRGSDAATTWAPARRAGVTDDDLVERLARTYAGDTALAQRLAQARAQRQGVLAEAGAMAAPVPAGAAAGNAAFVELARQAGRFLAADGGPAVAWLDSNGWDTHTGQTGRLARQLPGLDQGLAALREALGVRWAETTVLVLTEFGRSVALNGSAGTDHGTGSVAFVAGGGVAGGRVLADWPGLSPTARLDGRDLLPTLDVRALIGPVLQRQFGLATATLQRDVLPGAPAPRTDLWRA